MDQPSHRLDDQGQGPVYDGSGTGPSDPRPDLKVLEGGGETSEPKHGHLNEAGGGPASREQLSNAEENFQPPAVQHENQVGSGYHKGQPQPSRLSLRGRITRRRAIFGGGMVGTIIALIAFLAISSGPFQFIHIAQLMQRFHFSHQQDAGNDRMGRIYRYARSGKVGETRLGWLGSKMHANMLADLEKIGLKPVYGSLDVYQGFEIDRSTGGSPFKDMSNGELTSALEQQGVNAKEISFSGSKATVTVKGYINQRRSLAFLTDRIGNSNIPGSLRVRIMSRYGLVTWHPLKVLDKGLNQKLTVLYDKWKTSRDERIKTGVNPDTVDTTLSGITDEKGNQLSTPGEKTTLPSEKVKGVLSDIRNSKSFKVTGGIAFAVGLVCTAKTVNDHIGEVRYAQVITPLIRMGMDAVTVGNQIMSGQDVDADTVSFLAKNFNEVDAKGNIVSTWNQSKSIQAQEGNSGGIDIDAPDANQPDQQGIKETLSSESPSWLSWTNNAFMGGLCSGLGQFAAGAASFAVGVLSGGTVSTVGQTVGGILVGPAIINKLTNLLAGQSVNVAATGAQWGSNVDYGSRLAANSMALQFGGIALSNNQSAQLTRAQNSKNQAQFSSKNVAYKLFNPYDEKTVVSKFIDGSSSSFTGNLKSIAATFLHAGKSFASMSKIFSGTAQAASAAYDYGFPEYGFSQEDLNNYTVSDPYANADSVATLLDSPTLGPGYIEKADKCFGVDITKITNSDGTQGWDAVPAAEPVNPYDPNYVKNNCTDSSDANWLKIRFFIFDTGIMEGYACYQGDDQSCASDGFGGAGASAAASATSTAGTSADLAHVFDDSTSVGCASGTKDLGIQNGYHGGKLVKIRICAVSNLPSTSEESKGGYGISGAEGSVVVNSRVSGAVYAMVEAAKKSGVPLLASSGFRTMAHQQSLFAQNPDPARVAIPGYSNHQMGLAIDFSGLPSTPGPVAGNPFWDWLSRNAGNFGYKNYPAEAWHWSVTGN